MKILAALILTVMSFSALAADKEQVIKALAGQYSTELESGHKVKFIIRSNGSVQIISSNLDYKTITMTMSGSSDSSIKDGLPVAHVIISEGSDEDTTDHHYLLTATGESSSSLVPEKLASFTTFNDGPNDTATAFLASPLFRYSVLSRKWVEVK